MEHTTHLKQLQKRVLVTFLWGIILCSAYAGPENIASLAKAKASSSVSNKFDPSNVLDGIIKSDHGVWISNSKMTFWG